MQLNQDRVVHVDLLVVSALMTPTSPSNGGRWCSMRGLRELGAIARAPHYFPAQTARFAMPRLRATGVVYPLPPLLMRGSPWHKAVRLRCLGVDTSDDRLAVTVVERGNVRHNPGLSKGSSSVALPYGIALQY